MKPTGNIFAEYPGVMNKYSIILPVRNGGEYVKDCVASILAQTYAGFNLLVLDNCSTDGTTEWLRSLTDPRIVLHYSDRPLTIEENWGRITTVPKNEFITLIGHDDLLEPDYLSVMDALVTKHPDASLWQSHFHFIDSKGQPIRTCKPMKETQSPAEFLQAMLDDRLDMMGTGFLMRSADYDAIGGIPNYPNLLFADFEMVVNLARKSYFAVAPGYCFSFRLHQSTTARSSDTRMQQAFERLMYFLRDLRAEDATLARVIEGHIIHFISVYGKGLSHRLLRTPVASRGGLSVAGFLRNCRRYADMLSPGSNYRPARKPSVWLARALDSTSIGRNLFLLFKKIYSKPVLK